MPMNALRLACLSAVLALPAAASERGYIERFEGRWSGSGAVRRNLESGPWKVSCTAEGRSTASRIVLDGRCRAAVFFSRRLGADIRYDPGTGRYSGVYTGSRIGPARLSGRRRGDLVELVISWPRPVNGDTRALMRIRNAGNGRFSITVLDRNAEGGQEVTSDLRLRRP